MWKRYSALALALTLSTSFAKAQPVGSLTTQVDALFAQWDKSGSPGAAVGILQDGALVYKRG